jgi:integrase
VDGRTYVPRSRTTLRAFLLEHWLPSVEASVEPTTYANYKVNVCAYLVPHLGSVRLQSLTPAQLNSFYVHLLKAGRRDGTALAPKSVRNIHGTLHRALSDAVRWGAIARNVAELAEPPKKRASEMRTWNADQLRRFLDSVRDDRLYAAWLLLASTGIRRGELLGLHWRDVDLDRGRVSVRCNLVVVNHQPHFRAEPKSARGRSVPIAHDVMYALKAHRAAQLQDRLKLGAEYLNLDLVICMADGSPIHPETFSRTFDRLVRISGVSRIHLHEVRHTYATLALQAGVHLKVVSKILGHSGIGITGDIYSHVTPALEAQAAETVSNLIRER